MERKDQQREQQMEFRILRAMKLTLTDIIKDTTVPPGVKHPLSAQTLESIRQCLSLIAAREKELLDDAGETPLMRPQFADEPGRGTVAPVTGLAKKTGPKT